MLVVRVSCICLHIWEVRTRPWNTLDDGNEVTALPFEDRALPFLLSLRHPFGVIVVIPWTWTLIYEHGLTDTFAEEAKLDAGLRQALAWFDVVSARVWAVACIPWNAIK